jgi:hypothetical protein
MAKFWQLSVSLKSPVVAIAVIVRGTLPVLARVTAAGLLAVPKT